MLQQQLQAAGTIVQGSDVHGRVAVGIADVGVGAGGEERQDRGYGVCGGETEVQRRVAEDVG